MRFLFVVALGLCYAGFEGWLDFNLSSLSLCLLLGAEITLFNRWWR